MSRKVLSTGNFGVWFAPSLFLIYITVANRQFKNL